MKSSVKFRIGLITGLLLVMAGSYVVKRIYTIAKTPEIENDRIGNPDENDEGADAEIKEQAIEREQHSLDKKEQEATPAFVTITGWDPTSNQIIDPINLWVDYETRTLAGKVRHGEKVKFIKRDGPAVLVETKSGNKGWVTYFFIKGFKEGEKPNVIRKENGSKPVFVTITGWDAASNQIINPINIWSNYETRTFAGRVRHGDKVKFIRRDGAAVLIETNSGKQGWLTYFFIKGFKEE